jgi:hypothetical protein
MILQKIKIISIVSLKLSIQTAIKESIDLKLECFNELPINEK